ncbi:MAG TPA: hypothetical protein VIM81_07375 [Gammaproteobacteria bacterium]
MVKGLTGALPSLLLMGCATTPAEVAQEPEVLEPIDITAQLAAAGAEIVDVRELDNGTVCERRVPTGSRIAEEWCYTQAEYEARREANQDILRQDMEEMRQQQETRRIAQQEARSQAIRGSLGR